MSAGRLFGLIRSTGRVAEPAPPAPDPVDVARGLTGTVQLRHVDAGSCSGCEIEVAAAFGPVYDAELYGARLVASPRHADALLVTGVVTHNMAEPLRRAGEATPSPRLVIAVVLPSPPTGAPSLRPAREPATGYFRSFDV